MNKINLEVHEARTFFSGPERQLKRMFKALRVEDKRSWFRAQMLIRQQAYRYRHLKGAKRDKEIEKIKQEAKFIRFYDRRSDSFGSGLLPRVKHHLERLGIAYRIDEQRRKIRLRADLVGKFHFRDGSKIEVRAEQVETVAKAISSGRGIIHCATNFGKTEVAAAIIAEYFEQKEKAPRVFFLIHRKGLVKQTYTRFVKHLKDGIPIVMMGGGKRGVPTDGVLVSTTQTASKMVARVALRRFLSRCDILFIDEFHLNKAWQASRLVAQCSAPMRFGLSGTIDRKNKIKLFHYTGMTGPIIAEVRNKELVEKGRSAKPIIRLVEIIGKRVSADNYREAYTPAIVKHKIRNRKVLREVIRYVKKDYRTLVTVLRVKHGLKLQRLLEAKVDIPVDFISGKTPMPIREQCVRKFERGESILIASSIFDVGQDLPAIEAWVNAAAGVGWELVLQRLGRTLRKKKGRNVVRVTDFIDRHCSVLKKHSLKRMSYYVQEEIADIKVIA